MFEHVTSKAKLCVSVASAPGNFGFKLHNHGYSLNKLDYLYIPLKVANIGSAIEAGKILGIVGMSVTMPFKAKAIDYLDEIEPIIERINSVNSILFKENKLYGYSTDYNSVRLNLSLIDINKLRSVLILGSGAMARIYREVLIDLGCKEIYYWARKENPEFSKSANYINQKNIINFQNFNTLINATPIGMENVNSPLQLNLTKYKNLEMVIESVSSPVKTDLVNQAVNLKLDTLIGAQLAFDQFLLQFRLYTDTELDRNIMKSFFELTVGYEIK